MLLGLVVGAAIVVTALVTWAITTGSATPAPRELLPSSPEYRNHQAMARWIERRLDDELVRPLLGETDQAEGRRLLDDFYGEGR